MVTPFAAIALQLTAHSIEACPDRAAARAQMLDTIEETGRKLAASVAFTEQFGGSPVRLVVLPEYLFTSYPGRIPVADFADRAGWEMQGPEYEALGRIAQARKLFLAGNAYEVDANFPGLYFQTGFVLSPSGEVVLRYRRMNSMFAPTPHDVWSRYLDVYGLDGVFPVARTEIGNLAAIASEEILYPEVARAHALRGAEIFVHSSSEKGGPRPTHKAIAKRARAIENLAVVVSANTAGISGTSIPLASADGNSMIVDHLGNVLAESGGGETFTASADLDVAALRAARRKPGMTNYLSRQRLEPFAAAYAAAADFHRADTLIGATPEREHFARVQREVIERLDRAGLI